MKNYFKVMLGAKSIYAEECYKGNYIGVDYQMEIDFSERFGDKWRDFNKKYIPVYLETHPGKAKVTAGLACATIWMVSNYLNNTDIVMCPDGKGNYFVGEIASDYYYVKGENLPHRRKIKWYSTKIERSSMSELLRNSSGSIGTYCDLTKYADEIENLIGGERPTTIFSNDDSVEDPSAFALEKHLEDFLVKNWRNTDLGKEFEIYDDGENTGQQFPTDTGPIDILAISKDKKTLLVVELKKGRASDNVVGQIQRYMGYVKEELAETYQEVKGVIIAFEDDTRIKRALSIANGIEFYRYEVRFKLHKT